MNGCNRLYSKVTKQNKIDKIALKILKINFWLCIYIMYKLLWGYQREFIPVPKDLKMIQHKNVVTPVIKFNAFSMENRQYRFQYCGALKY